MNCKQYQERIDEFLMMEGKQLTKEERIHIDSCESCNEYYNRVKETMTIINKVRVSEPQLDDPKELTDSIMSSISGIKQVDADKSNTLVIITRILAAAVIALFITLGFEQYLVLKKIQKLETKLNDVPNPVFTPITLIQRAGVIDIQAFLDNDDSKMNLSYLSAIRTRKQFNRMNFTLDDYRRYMNKENIDKSFLEKNIKSK